MKPIDQTKKDVCLVKAFAPKISVEKGRPSGEPKNTPVANYPEKQNTSPTATKVNQNGKIPPKNGKTNMFILPYLVYNIDYNIVDDLKKSMANITHFDLLKLTQQRDFLLKAMNERNCKIPTIPSSQTKRSVSRPISAPSTAQTPSAMEATLSKMNQKPQDVSATMIGRKSKSMTPPLNMNVCNCLVDSSASSTVMPYVVAKRLHVIPKKIGTQIMQLDRTNVKVIGELKNVLIRMAAKPQYTQVIDIVVVNIPEAYEMMLSRD